MSLIKVYFDSLYVSLTVYLVFLDIVFHWGDLTLMVLGFHVSLISLVNVAFVHLYVGVFNGVFFFGVVISLG
jgi:hypothetical protein